MLHAAYKEVHNSMPAASQRAKACIIHTGYQAGHTEVT